MPFQTYLSAHSTGNLSVRQKTFSRSLTNNSNCDAYLLNSLEQLPSGIQTGKHVCLSLEGTENSVEWLEQHKSAILRSGIHSILCASIHSVLSVRSLLGVRGRRIKIFTCLNSTSALSPEFMKELSIADGVFFSREVTEIPKDFIAHCKLNDLLTIADVDVVSNEVSVFVDAIVLSESNNSEQSFEVVDPVNNSEHVAQTISNVYKELITNEEKENQKLSNLSDNDLLCLELIQKIMKRTNKDRLVSAILIFSENGFLATCLSKYRFLLDLPIVVLSPSEATCSFLKLIPNVTSVKVESVVSLDQVLRDGVDLVRKRVESDKGSIVVLKSLEKASNRVDATERVDLKDCLQIIDFTN